MKAGRKKGMVKSEKLTIRVTPEFKAYLKIYCDFAHVSESKALAQGLHSLLSYAMRYQLGFSDNEVEQMKNHLYEFKSSYNAPKEDRKLKLTETLNKLIEKV